MPRIDLGGIWTLIRVKDGSSRPATLPGDILTALVASGECPDPLVERNELEVQWVAREDWSFVREFDIDGEAAACKDIFIEIEVLDTVAEVLLNGAEIGRSESMFLHHRLPVGDSLRKGSNRIEIRIHSPELAAAEKAKDQPYPVPWSTYPYSSPHRNLLRKAQCMSGWDWGPDLLTGGVYDGIALIATDAPRIEYLRTRQRRLAGSRWALELSLHLRGMEAGQATVKAEIAGCNHEQKITKIAGSFTQSLTMELDGIEEWWPAGMGTQKLYELRVEVQGAEGAEPQIATKRLGFRELRLVSEPDGIGRSFLFEVNGKKMFAKGANWIPADALPSAWTKERMADLLGSARDANMNMLRVWGGGRYESDIFYDLCDELGLLIWQDAMFSCALYPSDKAFLALVEAEMRHQVPRLADHPCLALWCGNNESLGAITWYEESRKNPARYIVDYDRLNEGTVGRIIRELDPDRSFWPSSPSSGPADYEDNWHGDTKGDMHFWSVWHEGKSFSAYLDVRPRFCSEFGFQSLPSPRIARSFASGEGLNATSPVFEHHQRHPRGNTIILETMSRYFRMPTGFHETLWLSQVQQAMAIRTAVEYWRADRPRCMGTLYWQLNDVWPAASWSSLDYDGGWKLLHYEARRFFDPVLLALYVKDGIVQAWAVNDQDRALQGRVAIQLQRFDGSPLMTHRIDIELQPGSSTLVWKAPLDELPARPDEAFLSAHLDVGGDVLIIRSSCLFLTEPKRCFPVDPQITSSLGEDAAGPFLRLESRYPAFWVTPQVEGLPGRWEDSGFPMAASDVRTLRYIPARGAPMPAVEALGQATGIMHLRASYA